MKGLLLASVCLLAIGCAGSDKALTPSKFVGNYTGTWVNMDDATDNGTSSWVISSDGTVSGTDTDPITPTTYTITGRIEPNGEFVSRSVSSDGETVEMDGTGSINASGRLTLSVVWQGIPAQTYVYTLNRR